MIIDIACRECGCITEVDAYRTDGDMDFDPDTCACGAELNEKDVEQELDVWVEEARLP